MRIASVEAITAGSFCYVRVTGDDGTTGVGESTFFGWPTAVAEIIPSIGAYLEGRDAFDTEHHWNELYRALCFRGMAVSGAISAVDQALWDLKAKHFEVPIWQLLGGRARRAVRAMKVLVDEHSTDELVEAARRGRRGGGIQRPQGAAVSERAPHDAPGGPHRRSSGAFCRRA